MDNVKNLPIGIRPALETDWEQVYPFLLERDKPLDSLEAAFVRYRRKLASPSQCVLVAETEAKIVGLAMAHVWDEYVMSGRKQVRFSTLYVLEDFRKQGVGKALFEGIRAWSENIGATWLEWYASSSAVGFYERLGYEGTLDPDPQHPFYELEFERS